MYSAFAYNEKNVLEHSLMEALSFLLKFLKRQKFELLKGSRLPVFIGLMAMILVFTITPVITPQLPVYFSGSITSFMISVSSSCWSHPGQRNIK